MSSHKTPDPAIRFKPEYTWPEAGSERSCPRCGTSMLLNEKRLNYLGKPWWCGSCQWQFTEKDLARKTKR